MNAAHPDRLARGVCMGGGGAWLAGLALSMLASTSAAVAGSDVTVPLGLGSYNAAPKSDERPARPDFMGGELQGRAAPTNQWYSSVIFKNPSFPISKPSATAR